MTHNTAPVPGDSAWSSCGRRRGGSTMILF